MEICRGCMRPNDAHKMRLIFSVDEETLTVQRLYNVLTSLEIRQSDGLPCNLCTDCWQMIAQFRRFRDMCIASDRVLRMQIKAEPLSEIVEVKPDITAVKRDCDDNDDDVAQEDANGSSFQSGKQQITAKCRLDDDDDDEPVNEDANYDDEENDNSKTNERLKNSKPHQPAISARTTQSSPSNPSRQSHKTSGASSGASSCEKFECDICGRCFFRKYCIEAHLRTHLGLKPYACTDCGAAFVRFHTLQSHRLNRHPSGPVPQFVCDYAGCSKTYVEEHLLREHVRRIHLGQRHKGPGLVCDTCGQSCVSVSRLTEHMYQHQDPSTWPQACDLCPKRFITKTSLLMHRNRHMNIRSYACTLCEARTYTKAELVLHIASHNKELTEQCDQCFAKFTTKLNVMRHVKRVHRKPYVCSICGTNFGQKRTLDNHMMRHTGEKPHGCEICGRRFIQAVALKRHMRQMHLKHGQS